jgi:hypothetical protein
MVVVTTLELDFSSATYVRNIMVYFPVKLVSFRTDRTLTTSS